MKGKSYSSLLGAKGNPGDGQQPMVGAGEVPESAPHPPDCPAGITVVPDTQPPNASLLEAYRGQVNNRSTGEYTILKVVQMLQSEYMRPLPVPARRAAILVALQAAGVRVRDVIDDAVQRTDVLANAQRDREKALHEFEMRKQEANRKVQAMVQSLVAEYDARIHRTNEEINAERDKFAEWKQTKLEEEQKIAEALSYLMDGNAPPA